MEKPILGALIKARATQIYYHHCHNLVAGEAFHSDHAFFAEAYQAFEGYYDSLVEYFIALFSNKKFKTNQVNKLVMEELEGIKVEEMCCCDMYETAVKMELDFQKYIEAVNKVGRLGLQNAVQGMATESDVRLYKIRQRLTEAEEKDDKED